jgi:hypothetical protein
MKRRALLGTVSAVGTVSITGCLDPVSVGESATKLARLSVANFDTDSMHTIDVRIERDDSVVHESTHTIDRAEESTAQSAVVDCTWDDVAGRYIVAARVSGATEWESFDLLNEAADSPDCVIARIQYGEFPTSPDASSLTIDVRERCDEVGTNYVGGCPAYISNRTNQS